MSEHASPLADMGGPDAGGQNVHVAQLARALADRGHRVTVFTRRDEPGVPDRVRTADGYVVEHLTAGPEARIPKDALLPYVPAFAAALGRRSRALDVLHGHFWMSGLAAVTAGRANRIPVVQSFHALGTVKRRHQGTLDTSPPERIELESAVCRDVQQVVATCSDEVAELARLGAPVDTVTVVPCGVDTTRFTPVGPRAMPRAAGGLVLTVGRPVRRKGIGDVVRALALVPRTELVVAGGPADAGADDGELGRLRSLARAVGVADRVRFLGRVDQVDVPALVRSADVVATVPWYEPFGIVPLEAMSCGRPVVASAVGGHLDTVRHGVTGLLVPPRDPVALAAALRRVLADDSSGADLGTAGRQRALSYDWRRIAARTEAVYARVIDAVSGRTGPATRCRPGAEPPGQRRSTGAGTGGTWSRPS